MWKYTIQNTRDSILDTKYEIIQYQVLINAVLMIICAHKDILFPGLKIAYSKCQIWGMHKRMTCHMMSLNIRVFSMENSDGHRYNFKVDSKLRGDSWIFFRLMFDCLFVVSPTILHDLSPNFASLTLPLPFPSCQTINTINVELHQAFKHYGFVPQTFNFNACFKLQNIHGNNCFPNWKHTWTFEITCILYIYFGILKDNESADKNNEEDDKSRGPRSKILAFLFILN